MVLILHLLIKNLTNNGSLYFDGFPANQLTWSSYNNTSISNVYDSANNLYSQSFSFVLTSGNSTGYLANLVINKYPNQARTLQVNLKLGTATNLYVGIHSNTTSIITIQNLTTLNTSTFTDIKISFTSPSTPYIYIYLCRSRSSNSN